MLKGIRQQFISRHSSIRTLVTKSNSYSFILRNHHRLFSNVVEDKDGGGKENPSKIIFEEAKVVIGTPSDKIKKIVAEVINLNVLEVQVSSMYVYDTTLCVSTIQPCSCLQ